MKGRIISIGIAIFALIYWAVICLSLPVVVDEIQGACEYSERNAGIKKANAKGFIMGVVNRPASDKQGRDEPGQVNNKIRYISHISFLIVIFVIFSWFIYDLNLPSCSCTMIGEL